MRRASSTWGFESLRLRSEPPRHLQDPLANKSEDSSSRGVAQSGRALRSGRRGPRFESGRPDSAGKKVGRVAEWLKAHDWKSCGHLPAWVRIPPRPCNDSKRTGWGSNLFEPKAVAPPGASAGDGRRPIPPLQSSATETGMGFEPLRAVDGRRPIPLPRQPRVGKASGSPLRLRAYMDGPASTYKVRSSGSS